MVEVVTMYRKILVPLDGSQRAEAILEHVENLATHYSSTVVLLQVVEPNVIFSSPYDAYPELNLDEAERRVAEVDGYLAKRQAELGEKGIDAQRRVEYGPVVLAILDVAAAEEVDLIAMASHGRTGLARVFYGSVTSGVLNRIDRPLLLIRAK
jgi:nucleotide-binding universal stress UspA family protein